MPLLEMLTIIIGIVYGYTKHGKEDRLGIFKKGLIIGTVIGVIFTMLGIFAGAKFILMSSIVGFAAFIEVILMTISFVIGTYIGDWLEERMTKG